MSGSVAPTSDQLTVGQVMRSATTTVEPDSHVASAAYLMKRSMDSALVITADDHGRTPLAVITDADISQAVADGKDLNDTRINQLHLPRPMAVEPTTPVATAAAQMLDGALQHLPVVQDGMLVGLLDLAGVCRALLSERTPT
jgi:signal-transduction protein with cAMP-binding, CBS, and nucleotidyltransferase domain